MLSVLAQYVFRADAPAGMDRARLIAETLPLGSCLIGVGELLHHLFLIYDIPDNADFVTMEGVNVPGTYWLRQGLCLTGLCLVFLFFRNQIFSVLKAPFRKQQRLQDGAFISALLTDDDADDMIGRATELFRGIPFSKIRADMLRSSKGSGEEYNLSHPCKLNSVDFFVSHSKNLLFR
jgi:hypothetical protein